MADTVTNKVVHGNYKNYTIHLTGVSDGTGEAAVVKLALAGLVGPNKGLAPSAFKFKEASWTIQGYTSIRLLWDHTSDETAIVLGAGVGYLNWTGVGGLMDGRNAGGTGDLLLTSVGAAAAATYDITLVLELKT